jgi:DNA-directed RNA polymerase specialized sigma24 family protein
MSSTGAPVRAPCESRAVSQAKLTRELQAAVLARANAERHYRESLRKAIDAGMSYREVADIVGQSPGTIHTLLHGRNR